MTRPEWSNDADMKTVDNALNKRKDDALKDIENAMNRMADPSKKAHSLTHKGVILYHNNDYAGARDAFVKAIVMDSRDSDAITNLGRMNERKQ